MSEQDTRKIGWSADVAHMMDGLVGKTKKQLRAEAVERLRKVGIEYDVPWYVALFGFEEGDPEWDGISDAEMQRRLIDLLTDNEPEITTMYELTDDAPPVKLARLLNCLERDYGIKASWDGLRCVWLTERAEPLPVDNAQADTWSEYFDPETRTYTLPGDLLVPNSNQLEPDSRENLKADIYSYLSESGTKPADAPLFTHIIGWLDRQEAITSREWCHSHDALEEELDRVRAERDELKAEIAKYEHDCGLLFDEKHKLTADAKRWADAANEQRLVAMKQADMVKELTAERDDLRRRNAELEAERCDRTFDIGRHYDKAKKRVAELEAEVEAQRKRANDAERGVLSEEWYVCRDRYEDDIAELTAERDRLKRRLENQAAYIAAVEDDLCRSTMQLVRDGKDIDKLTAERDQLKERVARFDSISSLDGIANLLVQFEDLTAERDELQAALKRERAEWESERDYADQCEKRLKELAAECDKLRKYGKHCFNNHVDYEAEYLPAVKEFEAQVKDLEAERDQLSRDLTAEHALVRQFEDDNERLREAIDAMGNGQFYAMYREACQERDELKCEHEQERQQMQRVIDTQRESFRKMEFELAQTKGGDHDEG